MFNGFVSYFSTARIPGIRMIGSPFSRRKLRNLLACIISLAGSEVVQVGD
jgi:hypothetical protein